MLWIRLVFLILGLSSDTQMVLYHNNQSGKFTYTLSTTDFVMSQRTTLPFVQPVASRLLDSKVAVQLNSLFVRTYS